MKRGEDIGIQLDGLYLVHHNLPGRRTDHFITEDHLLFLPVTGHVEIPLQGKVIRAEPGELVYLAPHTAHGLVSSVKHGERFIALVHDKTWSQFFKTPLAACKLPYPAILRSVFMQMMLFPKSKTVNDWKNAFLGTLAEIAEADGRQKNYCSIVTHEPQLAKAISFIEEHHADPIKIEDIAKAAGMSVRSLNRKFADQLRTNPKDFQTQCRVKAAEKLLASGMSVTAVSLEVGYASLSQFIAVFRKYAGTAPSSLHKASPILPG